MTYKFTKLLMYLGSIFFLFEAIIHFFGLSILEHNKIFIPTHDRYIALFSLTYSFLLLISTNFKKYRTIFKFTMFGIALAILNATLIAYSGGYAKSFQVTNLDYNLKLLGFGVYTWYFLTLIFFYFKK